MMPPPRLGDQPLDPDAPPLERNVFRFDGASLQFLAPFRVFDEETNEPCRTAETRDIQRVVAERWRHHAKLPPGAVKYVGHIEIAFAPADPGRVYRLECSTGKLRARYQGPQVPRDALD